MASAISRIGRTSAFIALRTPTLSTVQNSSKNSCSASVTNPIRRGTILPCIGLPSRYSVAWRDTSSPSRPVAGNGFLDARGIVTDRFQTSLGRGQQDRATRMPHQDCRARMLVVGVKLLHGQNARMKLLDNLDYTVVHRKDAQGHVGF